MELSYEIKEDIRKSQSELKNAIRIHQVWAAKLEEDGNNDNLKNRVKEAERFIVTVSQKQKQIFNQLRKDLDYHQERQRARNKQVNIESDLRNIAQQIKDHILKYKASNRSNSLLKPSVLTELHIKTEHQNGDQKAVPKDGEYVRSAVMESRNNFTNVLSKVKDSFLDNNLKNQIESWQAQSAQMAPSPPHSESPSPHHSSPEPEFCTSPRALQKQGASLSQELFLRMIGLVTQEQKETLEKKRSERKKRPTTSTNRNEFVYGSFDNPKRKKYPNFPYLQSHSTPPQTRAQKQRKENKKKSSENASRETSPSSGEHKEGKPAWALSLPKSLTVETIYPNGRRGCSRCGKEDSERCNCMSPETLLYKEKLAERSMLEERNKQLKAELRRLEVRANTLKLSMTEHSSEKRELLENQMQTQRNLQQLLDFVGHFKDTSVSIRTSTNSNSSDQNQAQN